MLLHRLEHTSETVDILHRGVDTYVEPGVALYHDVGRQLTKSQYLAATNLLEHITVVYQSFFYALEARICKLSHTCLYFGNILAQQIPYYLWVA